MSHRLDRFHQRLQSTRAMLGWFGVIAAATALAALSVTCAAQAVEPGALGQEPSGWPVAGWESRILAVADLDGDGQPDFIVQTGDREVLMLSSRAHAGRNLPAATLVMQAGGC